MDSIPAIVRKRTPVLLFLLLCVTFLPWLGSTLFYTKGEPREAIVALTMLNSGNWILPVSAGTDIPFKPPFLAWCIAAVSAVFGGVSEFTSRLPSAVALICLAMATYRFLVRAGHEKGFAAMSVLVMVSCVEVWRAGFACRVDMVLTACMVGAYYCLYGYIERNLRGVPWGAVLLMTCAVLTKGPVGMLLPCLVAGVYGLVRGHGFWSLFWRLSLVGIGSCVVPALWYVAAYQEGGKEFLDLALEENFGRFLGKMSYESHVKPVWYNFVTIALGILPYTLLCLLALFTARYRRLRLTGQSIREWWNRFRSLQPATVFAVTSAVVTFVFYCIPKSKRSVYLLPVYPFLAYFITLLIVRLGSKWPAKVFSALMVAAAGVAVVGVIALPLIPQAGMTDMRLMMPIAIPVAVVAVLGLIVCCESVWGKDRWRNGGFLAAVLPTLWLASAVYLPAAVNGKSDKAVLETVKSTAGIEPLYGYSTVDKHRFFTLNFYCGDRMRVYDKEFPQRGALVVGDKDFEVWSERYGGKHKIVSIVNTGRASCDTRRQKILIVTFE